MRRIISVFIALQILSACANHPVDCAVGFHHADCLPGTAGYDDPDRFSVADDNACQSFGLKPGTSGYTDCRLKLQQEHINKTGIYQ